MKSLVAIKIGLILSMRLFSKGSGIDLWGDVEKLDKHNVKLYVFEPEDSIKNGTGIIICPGGSYHHLGLSNEGYKVAEWLNSMGITAFVLKYRVGFTGWKHPAMIQDLQRSIQIVRKNAKKYKLNENSIGVMGFSAGAHLVGTASIYYEENFMKELGIVPEVSLRPDFSVMLYPVVSMHEGIVHERSRKNLLGKNPDKELIDKFSLEDNVHSEMPPTLIIHAKDDSLVNYNNSTYLYESMKSVGANADLILYESGGHGFGFKQRKPIVSVWTKDFVNWLGKLGIVALNNNNE